MENQYFTLDIKSVNTGKSQDVFICMAENSHDDLTGQTIYTVSVFSTTTTIVTLELSSVARGFAKKGLKHSVAVSDIILALNELVLKDIQDFTQDTARLIRLTNHIVEWYIQEALGSSLLAQFFHQVASDDYMNATRTLLKNVLTGECDK